MLLMRMLLMREKFRLADGVFHAKIVLPGKVFTLWLCRQHLMLEHTRICTRAGGAAPTAPATISHSLTLDAVTYLPQATRNWAHWLQHQLSLQHQHQVRPAVILVVVAHPPQDTSI